MKTFTPHPKPWTLVSPALRQSAKGRPCTVRWSQNCDASGETTVLAHIRGTWCGIAQKPHDIWACFACFHCHSSLDLRGEGRIPPSEVMRAVFETQAVWLSEGFITVKGQTR